MSKQRGATPEIDRAAGWITEGPITRVDPTPTGWAITADGWTTHLTQERAGLRTPTIGDTFTTFGQIGYNYHGQALNGEVLWYQSIEDEEAQRLVVLAAAEQRRRDRFAAEQASMARPMPCWHPTSCRPSARRCAAWPRRSRDTGAALL